jgi:pyruvate dehydrogenase E1 component alpha subunit
MVSLMPRKEKSKSATTAKKQKGKSSRVNSKPARKTSAKKQKQESEVLPVLNSEKLKELYATMVKCRMLAERVQSGQTSEWSSDRTVRGFEATLVGAGAHLLSKDCIAMEHSSFVASLIKGTPLHSILARNKERQTGNSRGASMAKQNGTVAAALSMKTVLALAGEMKRENAVMLMFCTHDPKTLVFDPAAMAMAAAEKLPLVCLAESNVDSRLKLPNQIASGPYIGADPAFYPRIPVDGCDVVGMFRVTQEAVRRAREGHGPALIECLTSRSAAAKNEAERTRAQYLEQDPLSFMQQYLRRRDLWSDEWSQSIIKGFKQELTEAFTSLENSTATEAQFDNVYSADGLKHYPAAASAR